MDVVRQPVQGWIEVIVGSMFSGKSEELIRRLRRARIARQKVQVFKPSLDTRFSVDHIVSHGEMRIESRAVLGSGSGVLTSKVVRAGQVMWGTPARPLKQYLEQLAVLSRMAKKRTRPATIP